ncbi:MAG: hypothetical protein GX303_06850 [Clostridiales bacterium]|nr:hypothetical protein [Clostridiales bacterium]
MLFNNTRRNPNKSKPATPPPRSTPSYCPCLADTGSSLIRQYIGYYIYVWIKSGPAFWMYPTEYSSGIVSGYMWIDYGWKYTSFSAESIDCIV